MKKPTEGPSISSEYAYVTKTLLTCQNNGDSPVIFHHRSLEELASYLTFHNLIIGVPERRVPTVSIEHIDGSELNRDELNRLDEKGVNIESYRRRISEALYGKAPEHALDPYAGQKNASIGATLQTLMIIEERRKSIEPIQAERSTDTKSSNPVPSRKRTKPKREIIHPHAGLDFKEFARQLIDTANQKGQKVTGMFNDYIFEVEPSSSLESLISNYRNADNETTEDFGLKENQIKVNKLLNQLTTLNFTDLNAVLDWVLQFQIASDTIGVTYDKADVINKFQENGFHISANAGTELIERDPIYFAKYIVGTFLTGQAKRPVHPAFIQAQVNKWKQKFRGRRSKNTKNLTE